MFAGVRMPCCCTDSADPHNTQEITEVVAVSTTVEPPLVIKKDPKDDDVNLKPKDDDGNPREEMDADAQRKAEEQKATEEAAAKQKRDEEAAAAQAAAAAAQAEEAAAKEANGLLMKFSVHETRKLVFTQKPLGLEFKKTMPMVIANATGHSAALGVQAGWEVTEIGGQPLTKGMDFAEAFRIFNTLVPQKIPGDGLPIVFTVPDVETKTINFTERPVGLGFVKTMPLKVANPTDHAARLGVQVGWKVAAIAGTELGEDVTFDQAMEFLKTKAAALPMTS